MHTYIQAEEDKGSAEGAMKKLQDALKYMNTDTATTTYIHAYILTYVHTYIHAYIHTGGRGQG